MIERIHRTNSTANNSMSQIPGDRLSHRSFRRWESLSRYSYNALYLDVSDRISITGFGNQSRTSTVGWITMGAISLSGGLLREFSNDCFYRIDCYCIDRSFFRSFGSLEASFCLVSGVIWSTSSYGSSWLRSFSLKDTDHLVQNGILRLQWYLVLDFVQVE